MYVLDNDTTSLFLRGSNLRIVNRVLATPAERIWLPAVVAEEQLRGRMRVLAGLNPAVPADSRKIPTAYDLLLRTLADLQQFQILPYTPEAEALYQTWPPAVKRLGTRDCRIAASAIVHGYIVVTCNMAHFRPIPGAQIEDWSV